MPFDNPILFISLIAAVTISIISFVCPSKSDQLNIIVLAFTAVALIWTTIDARKNAIEAQLADLRPVILRDGVILSWSDFKTATQSGEKTTNFFVASNVATNVTGYVVMDGKKYDFSFSVTRPGENPNQFVAEISRESVTTWTLPNKPIVGITYPDRFTTSSELEGFYIHYSDVDGNEYETYESPELQTRSRKL